MAYPKYQQTFTERGSGYGFRVTLLPTSWDTTTVAFDFAGYDHTEVMWEPDGAFGDDEYGTVFWLASGTVSIQDPSYTIADDIFAAGEGGFDLHIERETSPGSGSYGDYVRLDITPHELVKTTDEGGFVTLLSASDPLASLSIFNADDATLALGMSSGTETPVKFILEVLDKVVGFDYDLALSMYWYTGTIASTVNALDTIEFTKSLWDVTEDGKHWTLATVIRHLLGPFQCRIYQYGGKWYITQYETRSNGSYREFAYAHDHYDSASTSYSTVARAKTLTSDPYLFRKQGGSETGMAAYATVSATYDYGVLSGQLVTNPSFESALSAWSVTAGAIKGTADDAASGNVRRMKGTTSSGIWSVLLDAVANGTTASDAQDPQTIFDNSPRGYMVQTIAGVLGNNASDFKVRLEMRTAQRDASETCLFYIAVEYDNGTSYWLQKDGTWDTPSAVLWHEPGVALNLPYNRVGVGGDPLPGTIAGDLKVYIYQPIVKRRGVSESGLGAYVDDVVVDYIPGEEENEATTYAVSVSEGYTRDRSAVVFKMADGPTGTHNSTFLNGGTATESWEVWDGSDAVGTGGSDNAETLLVKWCERILEGRAAYPARHEAAYFSGTGLNPIEPIDTPQISSTYYGLHRLVRSLHGGSSDVEMYEFNIQSVTIAINEEDLTDTAGGVSPGGGSVSPIIGAVDDGLIAAFQALQVGPGAHLSELVNLRNDGTLLSGDIGTRADSGVGGGGTWLWGIDTVDGAITAANNSFKITEGSAFGVTPAAGIGDRLVIDADGNWNINPAFYDTSYEFRFWDSKASIVLGSAETSTTGQYGDTAGIILRSNYWTGSANASDAATIKVNRTADAADGSQFQILHNSAEIGIGTDSGVNLLTTSYVNVFHRAYLPATDYDSPSIRLSAAYQASPRYASVQYLQDGSSDAFDLELRAYSDAGSTETGKLTLKADGDVLLKTQTLRVYNLASFRGGALSDGEVFLKYLNALPMTITRIKVNAGTAPTASTDITVNGQVVAITDTNTTEATGLSIAVAEDAFVTATVESPARGMADVAITIIGTWDVP
jgi:hypothetical protein